MKNKYIIACTKGQ